MNRRDKIRAALVAGEVLDFDASLTRFAISARALRQSFTMIGREFYPRLEITRDGTPAHIAQTGTTVRLRESINTERNTL